jgi:hypothetical protein
MNEIIEALQKVYGKAGNTGFGSAVFYAKPKQEEKLAITALENYKFFMGEKWNTERESAWMSGWKLVYERSPGTPADILTELSNIKNADAKRSVPLLTELIENAEEGKLALAAAFNHPEISMVEVFTVGDSEAMSGLLVCGLYTDRSVCTVICLMD